MRARDEARAALALDTGVRQSPGDSLHPMSARAVQRLRDAVEELLALLDEPVPADDWATLDADFYAQQTGEPAPADEREALRAILDDESCWEYNGVHVAFRPRLGADAVLAAGFRRQGPITDAQVDTVWRVLELDDVGHISRSNVRAALEAAEVDR